VNYKQISRHKPVLATHNYSKDVRAGLKKFSDSGLPRPTPTVARLRRPHRHEAGLLVFDGEMVASGLYPAP